MKKNTIILSAILLVINGSITLSSAEFTPIWHCTGADSGDEYGRFLVSAGDQNMDGYDDILISNFGTNEVYLYFGGNPMDTIPDMVFSETCEYCYGVLPLECRDLNGDNHPDFCISADCFWLSGIYPETYVYFGGPLLDNHADLVLRPDSLDPTGSEFGYYSSMGDFNGDGIYDLVISANNYDIYDLVIGKLYIYYGGINMDAIPDWTLTADFNNIHALSCYISCSGDLNNDGFDDIVCRGHRGPYPPVYDGRMGFFGSSTPDTLIDWEFRTFGGYPFSMGYDSFIIPDVNNDGYDEIVVAANDLYASNSYLFYGGNPVDTLWDVRLHGYSSENSGCAYIGDVNNDGWPDAVNGYWARGEISVFFLGPGMGNQKNYDLAIEYPGIGLYKRMGYSGDINGDGVDDFMFTSYFEGGRGEVFIYSDTTLASMKKPDSKLQAASFELLGNYPNPFNSSTTITFNTKTKEHITLQIYNALGQKVVTLIDNKEYPGSHSINWEGRDTFNNSLPSGVYLVQLSGKNHREVKRIQIIR